MEKMKKLKKLHTCKYARKAIKKELLAWRTNGKSPSINNLPPTPIEAIKEQIPESDIRNEILDFIDASDKGVIRGMI